MQICRVKLTTLISFLLSLFFIRGAHEFTVIGKNVNDRKPKYETNQAIVILKYFSTVLCFRHENNINNILVLEFFFTWSGNMLLR